MAYAQEVSCNQPTIYFRADAAFKAVAKILGREPLNLCMAQTQEELDAWDWKSINSADPTTWPIAPSPTPAEFKHVGAVYNAVKERKDKEAQDNSETPKEWCAVLYNVPTTMEVV